MPETPSTIRDDIAELERQLTEKKAVLEHDRPEKDVLHEMVGEKIQKYTVDHAARFPDASLPKTETGEIPSYSESGLKEKVSELIDLVFNRNLEEGLKEAIRLDNPALLDAFHDLLTDELYNQLIEKRKLDKVE